MKTNQEPTIKFEENKIRLRANISFEIFDDAYKCARSRKDLSGGRGARSGEENHSSAGDEQVLPEASIEDNEHSIYNPNGFDSQLKRSKKSVRKSSLIDNFDFESVRNNPAKSTSLGNGSQNGESTSRSTDSDDFGKIGPWKKPTQTRSAGKTGASKLIRNHIRTSSVAPNTVKNSGTASNEEWNFGGQESQPFSGGSGGGVVIWPKLIGERTTSATAIDSATETETLPPEVWKIRQSPKTVTSEPSTTIPPAIQPIPIKIERPILRIELHSEVELTLRVSENRVLCSLRFTRVTARLAESQIVLT